MIASANLLVQQPEAGGHPSVAMKTIPITYGEFYDVPRMIRFRLGGKWYFMRSRFDEEKDDYTDFYEVYCKG
jgi:hypothetical protein